MSYELAFGYLKERGFADRVKVFEGVGTTENCLLASQALGVGVGDICKSMIFHDRDDSSAIMVLAAGDVKFTMWASIFATVVCRTLLSYLLCLWLFHWGVIGITVAMVLDWCIKAALDIWRFRSGKWKNKRVI